MEKRLVTGLDKCSINFCHLLIPEKKVDHANINAYWDSDIV
jgi:hypothetical protein